MRRRFGARMLWADCLLRAMHNVVVDAVFNVGRTVLGSKQAFDVRLVLGEQQLGRAFAVQPAITRLSMVQLNHRVRRDPPLMQLGPRVVPSPRPDIAEPYCWHQTKIGGFRPAVRHRDLDQDVLDVGFGILHEHIEVAIVVKRSRVEQLKLRLILGTPPVFLL